MISPNSEGGPNIAIITLVCGWTFLLIALMSISLVLLSRLINGSIGPDDCLTVLALATAIALIAQTTWAIVDEGQDRHEAEVAKTKFALIVRSLLVNEALWGVVNTFIRISATLFIYKVFGRKKSVSRITLSLLVLCVLYGLAVLLEFFLICRPMAVDWNPSIKGKCGDQIASYLVLEILGLLLDFAIVAIPIPVIWSLQMKRAQRLRVLGLLSIGILASIITGLRIQALRMVNAEDFTYSKGYLGLLSTLGASLGIIFCCVPSSPGVYMTLRDKFKSSAVNTWSCVPMFPRAHGHVHGKRRSNAFKTAQTDEEVGPVAQETPSDTSHETVDDGKIWDDNMSVRTSLDSCVAGAEPLPHAIS